MTRADALIVAAVHGDGRPMRLTSVSAQDLGPFEDLHLTCDDPMTVIVGPNGAGKSNLLTALAVVSRALGWASGAVSEAYAELQPYRAAVRQGSTSGRLAIQVGVDCTEGWERDLWVSFVQAVLISALDAQPASDKRPGVEAYVDSVTEEAIDPLLHGRVVVQYTSGRAGAWSAGYEFTVDDRVYCVPSRGPAVADSLVVGELMAVPPSGFQGRAIQDMILRAGELPERFELSHLLPSEAIAVAFKVPTSPSPGPRWMEDFLAYVGPREPGGRDYSAAAVLHCLVSRSLTLLSDQRAQTWPVYQLADLGKRPDLMDGSRVPLELYRLKNGDVGERRLYGEVKTLFRELTSWGLGLRSHAQDRPGAEPGVVIEPTVLEGTSEIPVAMAGAGAVESMVLSTLLCGERGRVVVLDEPAIRLGATFQRRLLAHLQRAEGQQILLVTHSPFLVPTASVEDLERLVRIDRRQGIARPRRLRDMLREQDAEAADEWRSRWRQHLASRTDVRSTLFAAGVILVEGPTEREVLGHWFSEAGAASGPASTPEALNLEILSVDGDSSFGTYVAYMAALRIPWVIVCDGPVLSRQYQKRPLMEQLRHAHALGAGVATPGDPADFDEWRRFWEHHGAHTLACEFGDVTGRSRSKRGEIEAYLRRLDPALWDEGGARYSDNKPRRAHWFVQQIPCPPQVAQLYRRLVRQLLGADAAAPATEPG